MLFNPRYGRVGCLAMPYYLVFEVLGPVIEAVGFLVTLLAAAFGFLDWRFAELLLLAAVAYGAILSVSAIVLEEISFRPTRASNIYSCSSPLVSLRTSGTGN